MGRRDRGGPVKLFDRKGRGALVTSRKAVVMVSYVIRQQASPIGRLKNAAGPDGAKAQTVG